jgi:hypothetical protein
MCNFLSTWKFLHQCVRSFAISRHHKWTTPCRATFLPGRPGITTHYPLSWIKSQFLHPAVAFALLLFSQMPCLPSPALAYTMNFALAQHSPIRTKLECILSRHLQVWSGQFASKKGSVLLRQNWMLSRLGEGIGKRRAEAVPMSIVTCCKLYS